MTNYDAPRRQVLGTLFGSPVSTAIQSSFFEVRWQIFLTAEGLLRHHDVEHLRRVQRNVLDCELRRIEAATENSSSP